MIALSGSGVLAEMGAECHPVQAMLAAYRAHEGILILSTLWDPARAVYRVDALVQVSLHARGVIALRARIAQVAIVVSWAVALVLKCLWVRIQPTTCLVWCSSMMARLKPRERPCRCPSRMARW